jgi:hypothetical protein
MTKNFKKITAEKQIKIFLRSKTLIYLSLGLHKYVQVIEEAFSAQKRPSKTSKQKLVQIFISFWGPFLPPGSGSGLGSGSDSESGFTVPIVYGSNTDPDP